MHRRIAHIALIVKDYDEAIDFYTQKLDFKLLEDTKLSEENRWVIVAPPGAKECSLILAKADNEMELRSIGNQAGGRVVLYLFTDNFDRDFKKFSERNIKFVRPPAAQDFGKVAVFEDLYGNMWDLIEPTEKNTGLIVN